MALKDFWTNVRTGAKLTSPTATVDSPRLNAQRIQGILEKADLWLTPRAVSGFDEAEFDFLSDGERKRLAQCVKKFLKLAGEVRGDAPATKQQVEAARPEFRCILEILRPDKYGDVEALVIGKKVEQRFQTERPEWVRELIFETGTDVTGDPALWIWVVIDDEAANQTVFHQNTQLIRERLKSILDDLRIERWPFIRFRAVSEQETSPRKGRQ